MYRALLHRRLSRQRACDSFFCEECGDSRLNGSIGSGGVDAPRSHWSFAEGVAHLEGVSFIVSVNESVSEAEM